MTDDEVQELLDELEAGLREDVQAALTLTAQDFAYAVRQSTELTAAAFSVSRIGNMWKRRVGGLITSLRKIARRGVQVAAEELDEPVPPTAETNQALDDYFAAVRLQLDAVGQRLSAEAVQSLADGVAAGESQAELKKRMLAVFSDDASQLGPTRAERIAMTEATSAFNAGVLAAAQALTGPERPLVKQWLTRNDERVRQAHRDANGQLQLLDDPFDVGGTAMLFPGDPTAPADLTINCRCIMKTATAPAEGTSVDDDELSAAADVHTGAMVALIPSAEDAARLRVDGGEATDQLHLTLAYLGDAADWSEEDRLSFTTAVQRAATWLSPVRARAFGVAQWNPHGEEPVWVYNIGDDHDTPGAMLGDVQAEVHYQTMDTGYPVPRQHSPWAPHVAAIYNTADFRDDLVERVGPVTFDRLRVAFGGDYTDFVLLDETDEEPAYLDETEEAEETGMSEYPVTAAWSTPGTTALAFENQQTGDGRIFAPGALFWDGAGPWPLQYADEMQGGHDGAQLAGAINALSRDGDRIPGSGVLYLTQHAGAEAALLLAQGAPLGVSVDLDDVDIEMVDATPGGSLAYRAKMLTASVLPTEEGGWMLTGQVAPELSASGTVSVVAQRKVSVIVEPDGTVPGMLLDLVAAAGDPDNGDGVILDTQRSGDFLLRITRGRVRGATLVSIPAYANARIVLDDQELLASDDLPEVTAAVKSATDYDRVLRHVRSSKAPTGAARLAQSLKLPVAAAQRLLALAASRGEVVRLARGLYTDKTTSARADHVMMDDHVTAAADGSDVDVDMSEMGDDEMDKLVASAWAAMSDLPPLPAAWFREPTAEELPPGGPGVNYSGGRIFGWVAQAGEPHAGYAKKITIDGLGKIDTTHFLRQRFTLDDGTVVKAGAYTMNVGHHRDGAECETSACQFDDTRTVAGIVTVGMNERGMWFSGAAAPWLSEWDRRIFAATQPSYHLKKGPAGNWQLRAVLGVPVPGHSSPLLASAVIERSQVALTAAAEQASVDQAVAAEEERQAAEQAAPALIPAQLTAAIDYDALADALVAAQRRADERRAAEEAELSELLAMADRLDVDTTGTEGA